MQTKEKITFLGMGVMGLPMAKRLLTNGYEVCAFNRSPEKLAALNGVPHVRTTTNAKEAIEQSKIICVMLADANAVERVLFNDNADLNGRTIIQHSTISSEQTLSISQRVEKSGGRFIDCPVLGSTVPAAEGRLVVLVGAHSHRDFDEFKPLLSCFGVPHYLGDIGRASIVKLALNQLVLSHTAALALSLSIIEKSGIDTDLFMEIVRPSMVYSPYFDVKYKRMKERNYDDPHWIASLFLKDANLIISEAQRLGINPASIQGTAELARQATQRGLGDKDMAAIYEVVRGEQSRSK